MNQGIKTHLINTNKFKTNLIAIFLSTPLERENVTKNAVLSAVLRRGCEEFKDQEEISKELEEIYGADFDCGLDKIGKNHVFKFYIESINDEYLPKKNENLLQKSIDMLAEIVFDPFIQEEKFCKDYVNQEKENIKQIIEGKKDNKSSYSLFRCMEEMYKNEPEGLYKYGYVEDLEKIDEKNLYEYYKKLINECKIDIFVSGKIENADVKRILEENKNIKKLDSRDPIYNKKEFKKKKQLEKENIVNENQEVTQGKLVIGYDVINSENDEFDKNLKYIGMMYNAILGGTANSKLFQNVREKASLAYTANSRYYYNYGNILVMAGIEISNYEKALKIIKEQVEAMEKSDFSDEDISNAKKIIISNIESISDEQDSEIIYFFGQELSEDNISIEQYVEFIKKVNREEIVEFAKKIKINTIYFLK